MKSKLQSLFILKRKIIFKQIPVLLVFLLLITSKNSFGQCSIGQTQIMTDACASATSGWTFTNGTTTNAIQASGYWHVEKTADVITSPNYTVNGTITVRFDTGTFGTVGAGPNTLIAEYNTGSGWTTLGNTSNPTSSSYVTSALPISGNITSSTFQIRFRNTSSTAPGIRLDNIYICQTPPAATPIISASGTLSAVNTTYGLASSTPSSFNVSGANMTAGILVTPPSTNFEVSLSSGSGYANTIIVGTTGTIASTAVYIRLKSTATVLSSPYSGNIVLTSSGATTVNVATVSSSVSQKTLTITGLTGNNKTYDTLIGTTATGTASLSGVINSDLVTLGGTPSFSFLDKNVGSSKNISTSGYSISGTGAGNYTLTQPSLTANITEANLTVSGVTATNKVYDRTTVGTTSGGSFSGVLSGDTVTLTHNAATFAQVIVGTGITVTSNISSTGTDGANYTVTQPSGLTADITQKTVTISGLTANNKAFDGNTATTLSGTATLNDVIATDVSNVSLGGTPTAYFNDATVGINKPVTVTGFTISGSVSTNYSLSQPSGLTADITSIAVPVITSGLTFSLVYGTVASAYTITASNSPTSYNATGLPTGLSINTTNGEITGTPSASIGNYNVSITATNAGGTSTPATLVYSITAKPLTLSSATAVNKVYDRNSAATITGTLVGIFGGDTVTLSGTGTFAQITVGTSIAVTSTSTLGGTNAGNYTLTQPTGLTANIAQKTLTVSGASVTSKTYTGTNPATITGATLVGIISPDIVSVSGGGTFTSVNVGTGISVTASLTLSGADAGNYSVTQPSLSGSITQAPLTITGLTGANKTYNANTTASLSGTPSYSGLQNGETFAVTGAPTATFATKTVGTAKAITVSGFTAPSSNYSITQPSGLTGDITVATLTITSPTATNKVYDGLTTISVSGTLSGIFGGDSVSLNAIGTVTTSSAANGKTVTFSISGADAANYILTQPGTTVNITPKTLTITGVSASNKVYDGNTTATLNNGSATLSGVIAADISNVSLNTGGATANFADATIATGKTVTASGYTIGGTASGNYSLTQPTGLTANITPNAASDIVLNGSFTTNSNIDYTLYQNTILSNTGFGGTGSIGVMGFYLRDGGVGLNDADALDTELTAISFTVTNAANIRSARLFNGTSPIGTAVAVGGTSPIVFTGLTGVVATDNTQLALNLRITFNTTVTDNQQMQFTVSSVTANTSKSTFAAANGGGAVSSTTGDINRIEVTADRLSFVTQPVNTSQNTGMTTSPSVKTIDINNNIDLDYSTAISITSTGTMTGSPISVIPSSGVSSFVGIIHTSIGTFTLNASSGSLANTNSNSFIISVFTYLAGDFRPLYNTDLSYNGQWEYYDGTGFTAVPDNKAPQNTTTTIGRIIINSYVTGGGSNAKAYNCDFIILTGGELNLVANDTPPVAAEMLSAGKKIEVLEGGILNIEGDIDVASTANIIVRSGGEMILNQASINYNHPMWEGTETFEGGSTVTILNWDFTGAGSGSLINGASTPTISANTNGYIFGNLIVDINPSLSWSLIGGSLGIVSLCENDFYITNASANYIHGATNKTGTNGFLVNGNMTIYDGPFSFGFNFDNNSFNHQFTINGNFECLSDDVLKVNHVNGALTNNLSGSVTFKGDVKIASSVTSFLNDGGTTVGNTRMRVYFEGGTLISPKFIDIAPVATAMNMNIRNNAVRQLKTQDLTTNSITSYTSILTVETGSTLHFGWANDGTTPLVIKKTTSSPLGTNQFLSQTGTTLIITSLDGIQQASGTSGNVQFTTANKSFNQVATFWYVGKNDQFTGDAITTASNAKTIICDLIDNTKKLTLINSTGITSPGLLDIRKGQFIETTSAYIIGTSGGLTMTDGTLYQIPRLSADSSDLIPRLTGISNIYSLSGSSTIELNGAGDQILRGTRDYINLTFSTSGSKTLSSALPTNSIDGIVKIQNSAILDVTNNEFSGPGGLTMSESSKFRMSALNTTLPQLTGVNFPYTITGGTVELYNTSSIQTHSLRGTYGSVNTNITYNNIELNSIGANVAALSANVVAQAGFGIAGTMTVNNPTCFQLASGFTITDAGTSTFEIKAGATFKYGGSIASSGASGNIRTDTRIFPTTASYGFVGSTTQTTGTGLPSSMINLYMDKDVSSNFVTLSSATSVTAALTFYKGKLDIVANNLTVDSSGSITGASASDYVVTSSTGTLIRNIGSSGTFTYPIGYADNSVSFYNPSTFVWSAAPGITSYALRYVGSTASTGTGLPASAGCVSAGALVNNGHWVGTSVGTATNSPSITFTRNGHTNAGTNLNLHTIVRRDNSASAWGVAGTWTDPGSTTISPTGTGQVLLTQTSLATANNFTGEFAIAKGTNTTSTAAVLSSVAATICSGTSPSLSVAITGSGSLYDLLIFDGTSNFSVTNYTSGTPFTAPSISTAKTYSITSVTIGGSCTGSGNSGTPTVAVGGIATWTTTGWSPTAPIFTDDVVFNAGTTYSELANINACAMTVKGTAQVTIPSTYKVTLSGALTVETGSSFTLENDTNLVQTGGTTNPNTGSIRVKRNSSSLYLLDYTLWSSSVENQNLYNFSPNTLGNRFYIYDEPTDQYNSLSSNNSFTVGRGYLIRVPRTFSATTSGVFTGIFTGKPNSGDITYSMSKSLNGFNATGNPYPSQINVHNFIDANLANIQGTLYFWRKRNNPLATSYATLTKLAYAANSAAGGDTGSTYYNTMTTPAADWVINVGQGFFVQAKSASNLVFTNAMRRGTNNGNQFFRTSNKLAQDPNTFKLNLTSTNGVFSQMVLGYSPEYTLGVDDGIDGFNINSTNYLCSTIEGAAYVIQGRPEFSATDIVPLQYKIENADQYSIAIEQLSGVFTTQDVFLKDKLTNTIHDLKSGPYDFGSESGNFKERFEVVYESPLAVNQNSFNENNVVVYKQNQELVVNTGKIPMSDVKVYDIRGRLLIAKDHIDATQLKLFTGTTQEVLLVKITSDSYGTVTKKVVN